MYMQNSTWCLALGLEANANHKNKQCDAAIAEGIEWAYIPSTIGH